MVEKIGTDRLNDNQIFDLMAEDVTQALSREEDNMSNEGDLYSQELEDGESQHSQRF